MELPPSSDPTSDDYSRFEDVPLTPAWWLKWGTEYDLHGRLPAEPIPVEFLEHIAWLEAVYEEGPVGFKPLRSPARNAEHVTE